MSSQSRESHGTEPAQRCGHLVRAICTSCKEKEVKSVLARQFPEESGEISEECGDTTLQLLCPRCGVSYHNVLEHITEVPTPERGWRAVQAEL